MTRSQTAEMAPGSTSAGSSVADASVSEADLETPLQEVALTRASVKRLLVESGEIALGRKPVRLMLTISRNVEGKKIRTQKSIEIFSRDRQASIGVLKLLGQELDMFKGESALPPVSFNHLGPTDKVAAALAKYYGVPPAEIERLAKDRRAAQEKLSKDNQAEDDDDL
jgi:hypothetical protein